MFLQFILCQVIILLSVEFHTASCDTFYIVPTPSSHCPGEFTGVPCLTLDQYASNSSQSQNITFLVEPGTYNLSISLTVSNCYNFTMSSTNATVVCTSSTAQFVFNTVRYVHISGMTFTRCRSYYSGAIRMYRVRMADIRNSLFIDNGKNYSFDLGNTNRGGALYIEQSIVAISDCRFENNLAYYGGAIYTTMTRRYSHLIINGSVFNNNIAKYFGGGIYFTSSFSTTLTLSVDNTTFSHNSVTSRRGGAIYINSALENILVTNTVFSDNWARSERVQYGGGDGGALSIRTHYQSRRVFRIIIGCQFINNFAKGCGGAIYRSGENRDFIALERNNFTNNRAGSSGGALYFSALNSSVSVTGSSFLNNTANDFGGAVYVVRDNSSVSVSGSSFINNRAVWGGAILSNGRYAKVSLSSSTFTSNSASTCSVLAIANYDHFSVNITNSVFTYNTATELSGGVACVRNASINILNSVFKHNFANSHAGVFYIYDNVTTVDGSLFFNNSARFDGGVFYTNYRASDFIIRRSQFSENSAGDDGGVLFIGGSHSFVSIDETIFDFNSAADRGGVIDLFNVSMEINRTNIYNNTAEFGGVMSACNSQVTLLDDSLFVTVDPLLSFCTLYEEDIRHFNITVPQEPKITMTTTSPITDPPTTTAPLTTTASPTSTADVTTIATSTTDQVAVSIEDAMFNLITIVLAVSLAVSVVAIIFLFLLALMLIKCPNKPKSVLPLTQEFYPTRSFHAYTSPVYNPADCSKEKDEI